MASKQQCFGPLFARKFNSRANSIRFSAKILKSLHITASIYLYAYVSIYLYIYRYKHIYKYKYIYIYIYIKYFVCRFDCGIQLEDFMYPWLLIEINRAFIFYFGFVSHLQPVFVLAQVSDFFRFAPYSTHPFFSVKG